MLLDHVRFLRGAVAGHTVSHEFLPLGARADGPCDNHCVIDLVQRLDRTRDFAKLDAIAAQLDLVVSAAEKHQPACPVAANAITGSIQPLSGRTERIRHEALGGQAGGATIASREAGASDIEFTANPNRHLVQCIVQHMGAQIGERQANRNRTRLACGLPFMRNRADRGFRRPVVIQYPALRPQLPDLIQQRGVAGLSTEDERIGWQEIGRPRCLQQAAQMAGYDLENADFAIPHGLRERIRIEHHFRRQQMQRHARGKRAEQDGVTEIGRYGRNHRHAGHR